jgi:AcrR family transcriptional regulator
MIKQRGQVVVDKILDTAERLFYVQGYNNTGINQVIEEADIAKASLYKHFESKNDLMFAYLQRLHLRWFERLEAAINAEENPLAKLLVIFDHHSERQQIRAFGGCPFTKASSEAGMSDPRILLEVQQTKDRLKSFIKQLVTNSGHKNMLTDKELAETIFLMAEGGIAVGSIFKERESLQAAKKIIQKLI